MKPFKNKNVKKTRIYNFIKLHILHCLGEAVAWQLTVPSVGYKA